MKHFENIFRTIFLLTLTLFSVSRTTAQEAADLAYYDSVEVSLLTCSPHEEVYSLYGHTAIRYQDLHNGYDNAFNWGIFNFNAPHFIIRFVFGLTDYELGVGSFGQFCRYYQRWGSSVSEQVLNLTAEEKRRIAMALTENLQPENRVYRYNFLFDNCATRPRNILEKIIDGHIQYAPRADYEPTFREILHEQTRNHPWATFGNDMLLGLRADLKTSRAEQEFLPQNLLYDFDHAQIVDRAGNRRPLVLSRRMAVKPGVQTIERDFPLTPTACAGLLFCVTLALSLAEWRRKKTYVWFDALLMLLTGLAGCVLFVMLFSEHPCTSTNLQLLLLNPLPLFFLPAVVKRKPTRKRWWRLSLLLIALFMLGGFFQQYAEGVYILASCLLIRITSNRRNDK